MKCPYPNCQKDYNDIAWSKKYDKYVNLAGTHAEEIGLNRIYLVSRQCHFCGQLFHEVYIGHENDARYNDQLEFIKGSNIPTRELIATYPSSKTKFESKNVPEEVRTLFNEAERCRSIGALTGVAACLRKTVYSICDDQGVAGNDYREKISNLPISGDVYKDLLKQIKFLGDNGTKPGGDTYTSNEVDIALSVLPVVIDKLYEQDEKIEHAQKILAGVRSKSSRK